jgi:hypothetical protein
MSQHQRHAVELEAMMIAALQTLRAQLEAASQRWPSVQHRLTFILDNPAREDGNRKHLSHPNDNKHEFLSGGGGILAGPRYSANTFVPGVLWSYNLSSADPRRAIGASARFSELAAMLWNVVSQNWPSLIHKFRCPHPDDSDAGVERRAWLGDYWKFYEREKILAQHEELRKLGYNLDWSTLYVPERDEWKVVGAMRTEPEHPCT